MDVEEFSFSGGEPLLNKKTLLKVMERIKRENIRGRVTTNGALFKSEDVKRIVEIGWDEVIISLDGPDAKINDYTRGQGTFRKIIKALELFDKHRSELGNEKPIITINMVLNTKNWNKLIEMVELMNSFSCDTLHLQALYSNTPACENLRMMEDEQNKFQPILEKARELSEKYGITSNLEKFKEKKYVEKASDIPGLLNLSIEDEMSKFLKIPCYQPWYRLTIREDGSVGPCAIIAEKGDINLEGRKIKDVWFGPLEKLRKGMLEGDLSEECEKCCSENIFHNEFIREELKEKLQDSV